MNSENLDSQIGAGGAGFGSEVSVELCGGDDNLFETCSFAACLAKLSIQAIADHRIVENLGLTCSPTITDQA